MQLQQIRTISHRRHNPLTGEWVLVSPHRTQRPWSGHTETPVAEKRPSYDPDCYLCPGNRRANNEINPPYDGTFVFQNDFSAMLPGVKAAPVKLEHPLLESRVIAGECRVICFSPRHDLTLAEMPESDIKQVVHVWRDLTAELGAKYRWVQVFENKGAVMGCSNPHPHGQVWSGNALPNEPSKEDRNQKAYWNTKESVLLLDYAELETKQRERAVLENADWLVVVPFWAIWPFETLLLPKRHIPRLIDLTEPEIRTLAEILKRLLTRYDNLFCTSFPYTMGWHGSPSGPGKQDHWQVHAHFYPPLLRSATVKKFMVGYEMLAEAQRDITPEQAAERLIALSDTRYDQTT